MITSIKKEKGFTLVETLVAIAILMVAIAGPLTVANKALTTALGSRNSMIATYLAQEGMETIKNIKDNNISKFGTSEFLKNLGGNDCTSDTDNNRCQIPDVWGMRSNSPGSFISVQPTLCNVSYDCQIYADDQNNGYYTYYDADSTTLRKTPFKWYYFLKVLPNGNTPTEVVVTVVVKWNEGSVPNEIRLSQIMSNTKH